MPARADARFELRLPVELLDRVDAAAGGRGRRAGFVRATLEAALPDGQDAGVRTTVPAVADSSPAAVAASPPTSDTLPTPGCPECGTNMTMIDGHWSCGDCGYRDR